MNLKFIEKENSLILLENDTELLVIPEQSYHKDLLRFYCEDIDFDLTTKIIEKKVDEIPSGLQYLSEFESDEFSNVNWIDFKCDGNSVELILHVTFNWEDWNQPITIQEFLECYKDEIRRSGFNSQITKDEGWASLNITLVVSQGEIIKQIEPLIIIAKETYQSLLIKLIKNKSKDLFVKVFEFPKEYESICSQYLIWFGEFLRNLGIDASVSTENKNGQTSIIVSPEDASELTSKIEMLFYQYISLPYSEYLPALDTKISTEDKFKVQMLTNQIESFKTQIQMKDAIIEMKELSIMNLKESYDKKSSELMLIQSMRNSDDIEILDGSLSLGEIKWGALKLHPKKLLDKIKGKV
ncbi:hypothetical protein H5232_05445 [Pseudoalteromonas sp. SG41-5]|uniref:hypothetical protein n=1 Tax=Pseudoalteromonas sp. SG41-5 TaxID=2760975 RepID=UPI001600F0E3|nr:hypothetical protein [Pseudoalteromonas sp. SG41-5]MBB1467908.1 hypothetical protein [Pseudoalteromonas sp. SG41-5]